MSDRVYYGCCGTVRDMGTGWACWKWEKSVGLGANLGKVESGIMDPFLSQAPWGVGFPQVASTGDTCLLGFGDLMT
jgi:hypothetical protein